jgi:acyl-ACP thioesterase
MYEEQRNITYYDIDCRGKMKLSALLRMVHVAADVNATHLGAGYAQLSTLGIAFFLQRFGLRVLGMPQYGEAVRLCTWPAAIDRGVFIRKGAMYGANGEKCMEWASQWVLVDVKARKLLRPSALPVALTGIGNQGVELTAEKNDPPLLAGDGDILYTYPHTVRYADVDTNGHMNNAVYGDVIGNAVYAANPMKDAPPPEWTGLHINYLAETRLGDDIAVTAYWENGAALVVGEVEARRAFTARVGFGGAAT